MQGSGAGDGRHSTPVGDPRRQRWKVWGALVLTGVLTGLMLGRLLGPASAPSVPTLLAVRGTEQGLSLLFDRQATVTALRVDGALTLRMAARGARRQGDWRWQGHPLRWRVREQGEDLLLSLVSTRPLYGRWQWSSGERGWRLEVELQARGGE